MPDSEPTQVWEQRVHGHTHRVEVRGSVTRRVEWYVDDERVASRKSSEGRVRLTADDPGHGAVTVRHSGLGKPRRATLDPPGLDLAPVDGSAAAAYEARVLAHPRRHAALQTAGGVATVVLPILLAVLAARFAFALPLPDLPRIPWPDLPDLPSIPWPDLPRIPWPDLPDLPGWVRRVLESANYVWPVLLAFVLARAEIRRRRTQAELRESLREESRPEE